MKSKSGRKINDELIETSALKNARKFCAKRAARLKELEVLKEETLPKIHTVILALEAGGGVPQTVREIKTLLVPHVVWGGECAAQTPNLYEDPGPASQPAHRPFRRRSISFERGR